MTTPIKILLGVLLIACLATFGYVVFSGPGHGEQTPGFSESETESGGEEFEASREIQAKLVGTQKEHETEASRQVVDQVKHAGGECEQGISGRVVGPGGVAVRDAKVYLVPGIGGDILEAMRLQRDGVVAPPVAMATTDSEGLFALGVKNQRDGEEFDIHILHPDYCDARISGLSPQPSSWFDSGTTSLKVGVRVFGYVKAEDGSVIPGAAVKVKQGQSLLLGGVPPGREKGLVAETDAAGLYSFDHLDLIGVFGLEVTVAGFSKAEKRELQIDGKAALRFDFELHSGSELTGRVFDPEGEPVVSAKVTAMAMSQKSSFMKSVTTDSAGHFTLTDLDGGAYVLTVDAKGYQQFNEKPYQAGDTDLEIILEQLGAVIVTALDKNGRIAASFYCNIKSATEHAGQLTFGPPVVSQQVRGAGKDGATIGGLRPMTYVAEVFVPGHAKNFSSTFVIGDSTGEPPRVTVRCNEGGSLSGTVFDEAGRAVAGAKIVTRPFGAIVTPFELIFPMPYRISRREVKSDAKGRFSMKLLHPGAYQLLISHSDYCTSCEKRVVVEIGQVTEVPSVEVVLGCEVSGIASLKGKPTGQIKVVISSVQGAHSQFKCEAVSDNEGRYVFTKRVPPGRFELMACNQLCSNIFEKMMQMKQSARKIVIKKGEQARRVDMFVGKQ